MRTRDYSQRVNKKMKVAALRGALSDRAREGRVHIVETFIEGDTPRTKDALNVLREITEARHVLVVLPREDETNWLSLRNEPSVHLLVADQLNTYDVLYADEIIFTADALNEFLGEELVSIEPAATDSAGSTDETDDVDESDDADDDADEEA